MRLLTCFTTFALVGLLAAAPTCNENDDFKLTVTKDYYVKEFIKYQAEHDIVKLIVPLNSINVNKSDSSSESSSSESNELDTHVTFFFVEADVQPDGSRVDQGLYIFREGKAKKILDNGRDAAASVVDRSNKAFFGAKDGLYVYNYDKNSADKYGPITDSIIAIEVSATGEVIYILTENHEVYKVTDNGEKEEKVDDVVNAKEIVLDYENNLYFYADDKKPYVRTADGIKKIEGLPESTGNVILFKPPFFYNEGAQVLINNDVYLMFPNGTSEFARLGFKPEAMPTAIAPEATLILYYAFDKKIYEYNKKQYFGFDCSTSVVEDLNDFLKTRKAEINAAASKKTSLKRKLQPSNKPK